MRRVLVILLIFLFHLQPCAASLNGPVAAPADFAAHATLADAADRVTSDSGLAANPGDAEELTADADLYDSLASAAQTLPVLDLNFRFPAYTPASPHLLFLPIIKPPPLA